MHLENIEDRLLDFIRIEEAHCIKSSDFEEKRDYPLAVVVRTLSTSSPHFDLNDYIHTINVIIDCWIADDQKGELFHSTVNQTLVKLKTLESTKDFSTPFGSLPVVGAWVENIDYVQTATSNRAILRMKVVESY